MKRFGSLLFILMLFTLGASAQWREDILPGYEQRTVNHADDYSGKVVSTVVRKLVPCANGTAVLYIHGFNDYFFQKELGDSVNAHCMDFYAVDLRKYGRSLRPGQRVCEARDIKEYYADIDSALAIMKQDGI